MATNLTTDGGANLDSLNSIFAPITANAKATIDDNTATQLKQLRANQAARGVLRSGVSDIPVGDINKGADLAMGNVQSGLANIFGNTAASSSLFNQQAQFQKMMADLGYGYSSSLANQIGNANQPSTLQSIFSGIGSVAPAVGAAAAFF
jgi:hypothetical protein